MLTYGESITNPGAGQKNQRYYPCLLACLLVYSNIATPADSPAISNDPVVARFEQRHQAERLVRSLKSLGNQASIEVQTETVTLHTLTLGPYAAETEAAAVVKRLKQDRIKAWQQPGHQGYVVHAGAMAEEKHFNQRYQRLKSRGYTNILTGQALQPRIHYIVRSRPGKTTGKSSLFRMQAAMHSMLDQGLSGNMLPEREQLHFSAHSLSPAQTTGFRWQLGFVTHASNDNYLSQLYAQPHSSWLGFQGKRHGFSIGWHPERHGRQHATLWLNPLMRHDERQTSTSADPVTAYQTGQVRLSQQIGRLRTNLKWQPYYLPPLQPVAQSHWHPVDSERGLIRGFSSNSTLQNAIQTYVADNPSPFSGSLYGGLALSLQSQRSRRYQRLQLSYTPSAEAFYRFSDGVLTQYRPRLVSLAIEESGPKNGFFGVLIPRYPLLSSTLQQDEALALFAGTNYTFGLFRGRSQLRFQTDIRQLGQPDTALNQTTRVRIHSDWLQRFGPGRRWSFQLAGSTGLQPFEYRVRSIMGWRPAPQHRIQLTATWFGGAPSTQWGYHQNHSYARIDWQIRFGSKRNQGGKNERK